MLKTIRQILMLCFVGLLVSCGGGGGSAGNTSGVALYLTGPDSVKMGVGDSFTFTIGGGVPKYTVNGSLAVEISMIGNTVKVTGTALGKIDVIVTDTAGTSKKITVEIVSTDLYSSAPTDVILPVGASSDVFKIGGGAKPYTVVSSDSTVASVVMPRLNEFQITGNAPGKTIVVVKDSYGKEVLVNVTVGSREKLFTSAPNTITVDIASESRYKVGGGTGIYTVASGNPSVATVSLAGNEFVVRGIKAGTTTITIKDSTGTSIDLAVTVGSGTPTKLYVTAPNQVVIKLDADATYFVGGGKSPYKAISSDLSVATVSLSGGSFVIKGVKVGKATIHISDSEGDQKTFDVVVGDGSGSGVFTSAPSAISMKPGTSQTFNVGGGIAPYSATSSAISIGTVVLSGTQFTITIASTASLLDKVVISVKDANGSEVPITVTVN